MKLSTKAQYAIQAMIKLAINHNSNVVTLTEITSTQSISLSYLEQLFSLLRKSGLVQGVRGPGGGYRLSKSPDKISISDIVIAVESPTKSARSKISIGSVENENYITNDLWYEFSEQLRVFLDSITLNDIVKDHVVVKNQFQLDEITQRISTMFPVSEKLRVA